MSDIYLKKSSNPNVDDIYLSYNDMALYIYTHKKKWEKLIVFDAEEAKKQKRKDRKEKLNKINET